MIKHYKNKPFAAGRRKGPPPVFQFFEMRLFRVGLFGAFEQYRSVSRDQHGHREFFSELHTSQSTTLVRLIDYYAPRAIYNPRSMIDDKCAKRAERDRLARRAILN